jgi:hypothetical protein
VHDISYTGCQLEVAGPPIELGGTALIEVPGAQCVSGRVVWTRGKIGGVEFERPLASPAAVVFGLEEAEPEEPEPEYPDSPPQQQGRGLSHWIRRLAARFS